MTRYMCAHPAHRLGSGPDAVDVTAQVRLERNLLPRPPAYLAITEDVIDTTMRLGEGPDRRIAIERLISGEAEPQDLPVVLMSRRSVHRMPGRYELDALCDEEPEIERMVSHEGPTSVPVVAGGDDVVVIPEERDEVPRVMTGGAPTALLSRLDERAPSVVPQGVFMLSDLAANLAIAERSVPELIDAIRSTPATDGRAVRADPWRVVVTCPRAVGMPPVTHDAVFTGTRDLEAPIVYGTPVGTWDAEVEAAALLDMAPSVETSRLERRVGMLLGAEVIILLALLAFGWASGGLALAARETPAWLAFGLLLAGTAIAFAALPLFASHDPSANMNDTYVLEVLSESRVSLLRIAAAISATLFGFALLTGVIPPTVAETRAVPAAIVTFDTSTRPITATIHVKATGYGADDALNVTMREYTSAADGTGTLIGQVTRHGTASGRVSLSETFAVDPNAAYISVLVSEGSPEVACSPSVTGAPGCTVLAVPQFTPTTPRMTTIVAPTAIAQTSTAPSPSAPTTSVPPSPTTPSN